MQEQSAILNSIAITECNLHVGAPDKRHMFAMAKPQFYDFVRKQRDNRLLLREYAKDRQIASARFISEDMLIRSGKEITKSMLPFLRTILGDHASQVSDLATFKRYWSGGSASVVGEEEARDNFFRE